MPTIQQNGAENDAFGRPNFSAWAKEMTGILHDEKISVLSLLCQTMFSFNTRSVENPKSTISRALATADGHGRLKFILAMEDRERSSGHGKSKKRDGRCYQAFFKAFYPEIPSGGKGQLHLLLAKRAETLAKELLRHGDENQSKMLYLDNLKQVLVAEETDCRPLGYELLKSVFRKLVVITAAICDESLETSKSLPQASLQFTAYLAHCVFRPEASTSQYERLWAGIPGLEATDLPEKKLSAQCFVMADVLRFLFSDKLHDQSLSAMVSLVNQFPMHKVFEDAVNSVKTDATKSTLDVIIQNFAQRDELGGKSSKTQWAPFNELCQHFFTEHSSFKTEKSPNQGESPARGAPSPGHGSTNHDGKSFAELMGKTILECKNNAIKDLETDCVNKVKRTLDDARKFDSEHPQLQTMMHLEKFLAANGHTLESIASPISELLDTVNKASLPISNENFATTAQRSLHTLVEDDRQLPPENSFGASPSDVRISTAASELTLDQSFQLAEGFFTPEGIFRNKLISGMVREAYNLRKAESGDNQTNDDFIAALEYDFLGGFEALQQAENAGSLKDSLVDRARAGVLVRVDDFHFDALHATTGAGIILTSTVKKLPHLQTAIKLCKVSKTNIVKQFVRPMVEMSKVSAKFSPARLAFFILNENGILENSKSGKFPDEIVVAEVMQPGMRNFVAKEEEVAPELRILSRKDPRELTIQQVDSKNAMRAYKRLLANRHHLERILESLEWLHEKKLYHLFWIRNHAPEKDETVLIRDLGLANLWDTADLDPKIDISTSNCPGFIAPEASDGHPLVESDTYSFAGLVYRLATGEIMKEQRIREVPTKWFSVDAFAGMNPNDPLLEFISTLTRPILWQVPRWRDSYARKKRPTASEAMVLFEGLMNSLQAKIDAADADA